MRIDRYTRGVIRPRATPRQFDPSAIQDARTGFQGVAAIAGAGADLAERYKQASDTTWVNENYIESKKRKVELSDKMRKERESSPDGFADDFQSELKKIDDEFAASAPSAAAKRQYMKEVQRDNAAIFGKDTDWTRRRQVEMFGASVEKSAQDLQIMALRAGRAGGNIDQLLKDADAATVAGATFLAPEAAAQVNDKMRSGIAKSYFDGVVDRNPYLAKKLLDSKKFDDELGADRLASLYGKAENEIKRVESERASAQEAASILTGELRADPANKQHRKLINSQYKLSGVADQFAQGNVDAVAETLSIINTTSIIPEAAQQATRAKIFNGTAEEKQSAYNFIAAVQQTNPAALTGPAGFTQKEINNAAAFNALVRSGASPQYAQESVEFGNNPINKDVRVMRESEADQLLKDVTADDLDRSELGLQDGFFFSPKFMGAQNAATTLQNYKRLYRDNYIRYGDDEAAKAAAISALKTKVGETKVTGTDEIMEYPPERYYGLPEYSVEENAEWMREELEQDLRSHNFTGDLDKVSLVPTINSQARVANGLPPQYNAFVETEQDGFPVIDVLRDSKNMPVAIAFDTEAQIARDTAEKGTERSKKREAARKRRAQGVAVQTIRRSIDTMLDKKLEEFGDVVSDTLGFGGGE